MTQLHRAFEDIQTIGPWTLLLMIYVAYAAIHTHIKNRRSAAAKAEPPSFRTMSLDILKDTCLALLFIVCLWAVQFALNTFLGTGYVLMGFPVSSVIEVGHLANILTWVLRCLLRLLP